MAFLQDLQLRLVGRRPVYAVSDGDRDDGVASGNLEPRFETESD